MSTRALSPLGKTLTDAVAFYSEHLIASNKQSKAPLTDAIGRFLGVRPEESLRLHWEHFDFEARELTIPPEIAKGGEKHARINQIPPNAMAWLIPYTSLTGGKILEGIYSKSAFDKRMRAARTSAGWPPGTWPQNALRKTFISCHFACYSNAPLTAAIAGTSESVIFSNYRSMIKKTEASKLWEIHP